MKKLRISYLFDKKWFRWLFSLIAAIVCWAIVVFTISPNTSVTIRNVPVNMSASDSLLQSLGLDIMDDTEYMVNVTVEGARNVVGTLDTDSITVTPEFTGISAVGTYDLKLNAVKSNSMDNYTITSVNPGTIRVRFDKAMSKKYTVSTEIEGLSVNPGFMSGNIVVTPGEITVIGAEKDIDAIGKVVAKYELNEVLDATTTLECPIVIYDVNGNELPLESYKLETQKVSVTIPVYKQGTLELDIEFTNVPDGFDVESVSYILSKNSIEVAASESEIDNLKKKIIGYVDLASFKIGETYNFEVKLPTGYVNLDNVETVSVTFPKENLSSKKINVSNIKVQNVPENYSVEIVTQRINDVTVIGPTEDVEPLLAGSVVAEVDLDQVSVENGTYNVPVIFTVTANDTTWVVGNYTVTIRVEPN